MVWHPGEGKRRYTQRRQGPSSSNEFVFTCDRRHLNLQYETYGR